MLTAQTGAAALLIGGQTLHAVFGVQLARQPAEELAQIVKKNKRACQRIMDMVCLVIDEISMVSAELLDKLNYVAQQVRRSSDWFGGIQVAAFGDFYQLPPVKQAFCFDAQCFAELNNNAVVLRTNYRQAKDPAFQALLTRIRNNELTQQDIELLQTRVDLVPSSNKLVTWIFSKRAMVDNYNAAKLAMLPGKTVSFKEVWKMQPANQFEQQALKRQMMCAPCEVELKLKIGAQVMLVANKSRAELNAKHRKVNGSTGVVVNFTDSPSELDSWPIVKFDDQDVCIIKPHSWTSECRKVSRCQVPLRVSFAITVHAAQGKTLPAACIDLSAQVFEPNQVYVQATRVPSIDDMYIQSGFDVASIRCHPAAVEFYKQLKPLNP